MTRPGRALAAVALAGIALAGCGGGDDDGRTVAGGTTGARPAATAPGTPATSTPTAPATDAPTASTTSGRLRGVATGRAHEFLGVRFAKPPVGARRWTLPEPAPRAAGTVDATKPGAPCAQAGAAPGAKATASTSEDCLFLNVTTPVDARPGQRLPVMVWWHGGGFTSGSGAVYDAQRLASEGHVVVVTANKRLGIFGYLGLRGLPGSGNFGFADQLASARWARENAEAFGGDPENLTVFGESDGGMAACAALTSPAARGLIDKVAISSGSCLLYWPAGTLLPGTPAQRPYVSLADNRALGASVARKLRCTGRDALACLRRLPTKALLPQSEGFSNVLAYGTTLLPEDPAKAVADGHTARIPVLSGGNRDEERAFHGGAEQAKPGTFTRATYPRLLRTAYGRDAGAVARTYPLRRSASPVLAFSAVTTDGSWACPTLRGNRALARRGPVYAYEFADPHAPNVNGVRAVPQGAAHATDVPFLFDLGGRSLLRTPEQRALARTMVASWTSFARDGRPRADGAPTWPRFRGGDEVQRLAPGDIGRTDVAAEHRCGFWDRLG
ncbi:carboxylesterase/lipase family protein [Patulibacter minatonensis]|uniref:carboxylesterase/lipase family protein n=1 Tax=Patulibacter minatonensis TaxID=298163 RepID=UPI000686CD33|nr:carboxylesterase family protein [Patulibacter minatonensis]